MKTVLVLFSCAMAKVTTACSGDSLDVGEGQSPTQGPVAQCGTLPAVIEAVARPQTQTELIRRLAKRWSRCDPGTPTTSLYRRGAGIEFTSDGTFFLLQQSGSTFVRMTGANESGTYRIGATPDPSGFGTVSLSYSGTSFADTFEFPQEPERMRVTEIQTNDGLQTTYVPLASP